MPQYDFPDEETLVRYLVMLREVIVYARLRAYETDPEIACLLDQVENVPDLLTRWPDMKEEIVIGGLWGFEKKYLAGHNRFSKILIDGPRDDWQLRWGEPSGKPDLSRDEFAERAFDLATQHVNEGNLRIAVDLLRSVVYALLQKRGAT